jgi:transcriptional regulator with XRE-family HTH domain
MKLAAPRLGALGAHQFAMDEANAAIADLVRARRIRLGVSLPALAKASGVELATLDDLENRREGCSAADLWRIAQALGASLADLCRPDLQSSPSDIPKTFGSARRGQAATGPARPARRIALH